MGSGSWGGFRQKSFGSALLSGTVLKTSAVELPAGAGKKIQLGVEKREAVGRWDMCLPPQLPAVKNWIV